MTNKIEETNHWWPNVFKNMSMIFNFEFGWFLLQVRIWACSATSAWNANPDQDRTRLNSWTFNGLNHFVSNVHSIRPRCNISFFSTSDDITILGIFSWPITKLWIRSATKFNEYPAVGCHWRASRFPCASLGPGRIRACRFPCAGFHLLCLLPRSRLWWNTHQSQSWFPLLRVGKGLGEDVCCLKWWTNKTKLKCFRLNCSDNHDKFSLCVLSVCLNDGDLPLSRILMVAWLSSRKMKMTSRLPGPAMYTLSSPRFSDPIYLKSVKADLISRDSTP